MTSYFRLKDAAERVGLSVATIILRNCTPSDFPEARKAAEWGLNMPNVDGIIAITPTDGATTAYYVRRNKASLTIWKDERPAKEYLR